MRTVFDGFFLDNEKFRVQSMNNISFNCFKTMFVSRNVEEGVLRQERDKLVTLKDNVHGIERLWEITFDCSEKEVTLALVITHVRSGNRPGSS